MLRNKIAAGVFAGLLVFSGVACDDEGEGGGDEDVNIEEEVEEEVDGEGEGGDE